MSTNDVRLEPINQSNWRQALEIRSEPDQRAFVADHEPVALVILAKSYIRPGGCRWEPLAILAGDTMVGVVALAHSAGTYEMFHLLIDRSHQGRGFGKAAVRAIVGYIRRALPDCTTLTLTVHPNNERAQRLYRSTGFRPTGDERYGEPVWQMILSD